MQHVAHRQSNEIAQLNQRIAELERQLAEARAALEHDRSAVADGLAAIRKVISGRLWLRECRGSFAWDDARYQQEFGNALDELDAAMQPLAKIAGDWSNCPIDPHEIARARGALQDIAVAKGEK